MVSPKSDALLAERPARGEDGDPLSLQDALRPSDGVSGLHGFGLWFRVRNSDFRVRPLTLSGFVADVGSIASSWVEIWKMLRGEGRMSNV